MNTKTERILSILIERFRVYGPSNFNLKNELEITDPVTEYELTVEEKEFVRTELLKTIQYQESYKNAILIPVSMVSDPRDHEEWYDKWLITYNDNIGSYYWKRLEDFLSHELTQKYGPENAGEVVKSIDDATFSTMKKLASPLRKEFSYKGLVVGYVQSGKTANFTALIAKAADSGYKLIIVLAGIHNVLRRQTQVRLDRELTGVRDIDGPDSYISSPGAAKTWNRLTTAHNDFSKANLGLFENYCHVDTPSLAVVKKNVKVLDRLIAYFEHAPAELRAKIPVLIIDDEADQASIDGNANKPDSDPTSTNERIRKILSLFSKKVYIGYTATPFANALINMSTEHAILQDDLYPRNFIVSLPEPKGYFGTNMIFKDGLSEKFVIEIPSRMSGRAYNEARELVRKGNMTNYLSLAIDQFIICCAVRNLRGDRMKPMSMLVHVSHLKNHMTIVKDIISNDNIGNEGYIQNIIGRYKDINSSKALKQQYEEIWTQFAKDMVIINGSLELPKVIPSFEAIWSELTNVFDVIQVIKLNSDSDDSLDYTTGAEIKVIAIGGNQLSRGLTLEGLMTSYYLRSSNQYDTLLQMGRWFGYRKNYEDLTRIHTTKEIWNYFAHLAMVENELRNDIRRYEDSDNTPADLALTILTHSRLAVTATNKLGAADIQQTSYSDSLHQTFKFPIDLTEKIRSNYNLGEAFISKTADSSKFIESWVKGVFVSDRTYSSEYIYENFIDKYNFEERFKGSGIDINSLKQYIYRRSNDNELKNWKIALAGNTTDKIPVSLGGQLFNKINRSRISNNEGYDCGVITDKRHLLADLKKNASSRADGRNANQVLLIIYVINAASVATKEGRIDLYHGLESEKIDVLGFAIILPKSEREPYNRIGQ